MNLALDDLSTHVCNVKVLLQNAQTISNEMHKQFKIGLPVHVCINYIICIDSLDVHPPGPDTGDLN